MGAQALTLAELENFHPENRMILANTTSIGMQPNVNETPVSKVCEFSLNWFYSFQIFAATNSFYSLKLNSWCYIHL